MGVRIDSSASAAAKAAKAGQQAAASRKDGPAASGAEADFSQVLAQARPKRAADTPASGKPAPVAKADGKKPVKAKARPDPADDVGAADEAPDAVADRSTVDANENEATPVDDGDTDPVAETEGDSGDRDQSDAGVDADQHVDPTQAAVAAAAAAAPPPPPQMTSTAAVSDDSAEPPAAKSAQATPAAATAVKPDPKTQVAQQQPPVPADGASPDAAGDKKGADVSAGHADEAPKPAPAKAETGVAIRPPKQSGEHSTDGETGEAEVQAKQNKSGASQVADAASGPAARFNELFQTAAERIAGDDGEKHADKAAAPTDVALAAVANDTTASSKTAEAKPAQVQQPPVAPDVRFAEDNHPKVVTAVKSHLLPGGGSIQLRLDPPDLGPLRLEVRMEGGSMSASFVTANDQATSLLTHTLGQLKHALEGAGISVDKLQVRQGSAEHFSENSDQQRQQGGTGDQSSARQEQQRREMLNRMWRKVAGGDPLDLVA